MSPLYDPGLQPERTRLAWARALLTLALGALVALRFLPGTVGAWSLGIGLPASAVLWWLATVRARRTNVALVVSPGPLPGGALLFGLALVAMGMALSGLLGVALGR